jgi:hypothetical protein
MIYTSEMAPDQKIKTLIDEALKKVHGATREDLAKNTTLGKRVRCLVDETARALWAESGDKQWLQIARGVSDPGMPASSRRDADSIACDTKQSPAYDTK